MIVKEARALLPIWVAGAAAMVLVPTLAGGTRYGVLVYFGAAAALGALSMGHEYTCRTTAVLLSQPVSRVRILLVKTGVLGSMLLSLFALAIAVFVPRQVFGMQDLTTHSDWLIVLAFPVWWGLLVAPWLTMLSRSAVAGMIFTVAASGLIFIVFGWRGDFLFALIAAPLGWRTFVRLEAIEGRGREFALPWLKRRPRESTESRKQPPIWLLLKKELRLQQLAFAVAGFYAVSWLVVASAPQFIPGFKYPPLGPGSVLYSYVVAVLIGSLAIAEERQAGTLEWQILMPLASWKQFAVKAGSAVCLSVILGIGLPAFLNYVHSTDDVRLWGRFGVPPKYGLMLACLLTTASLYVSSVCKSGMRSLLLSFPVVGAVAIAIDAVAPIRLAAFRWFGGRDELLSRLTHLHRLESRVMFVVAAALVLIVVRLTFLNYRSADLGTKRIARQGLLMLGYFTIVPAVVGAVLAAFYH